MSLQEALEVMLGNIDYTAPARACDPWQPVCEVLPQEVIKAARKALDEAS